MTTTCKAITSQNKTCAKSRAVGSDYCTYHGKFTHKESTMTDAPTIVVLTFDEDPEDPIIEVVGPFTNHSAASAWIDTVEERLRSRKARYMTMRLSEPFTL